MWIEVIGTLSSVGLLVLIPMFIVKSMEHRKGMSEYTEKILESNRKRIEAVEQHQKYLRAYGDYFKEFQEWYEIKLKEDD